MSICRHPGIFVTVRTVLQRKLLEFFMEITNMLGRRNPCCVRYNLRKTPDGTPLLERDVGQWLPLIVSAGVFWEF